MHGSGKERSGRGYFAFYFCVYTLYSVLIWLKKGYIEVQVGFPNARTIWHYSLSRISAFSKVKYYQKAKVRFFRIEKFVYTDQHGSEFKFLGRHLENWYIESKSSLSFHCKLNTISPTSAGRLRILSWNSTVTLGAISYVTIKDIEWWA